MSSWSRRLTSRTSRARRALRARQAARTRRACRARRAPRRPRALLARLLILATLALAPVGAAGCGAAGHYALNVVAHHLANHFARTPAQRRAVNRAFCAYSVYRAFHDLTHHHLIFGALNAHAALRNCEAGFARNAH